MIPGWLVALATFPGVIVHEAAHMLFCKLRGVTVLEVCFLRFGNPVGYVIHEETKDFTSSFLVCVGPLIVNSVLCMVFCFPSLLPIKYFHHGDGLDYVLMWLGVSIGMHAFPSTQDATNLWNSARTAAKKWNLLALASMPLVGLIFVANIASIFWFDYWYGLALGVFLPMFLLDKFM